MTKRILIISKVRSHPITMGNSKAIVAQAEMLRSLGCEIDYVYIQETRLHGGSLAAEESYQQTKAFWGNHFHYLRVSKLEHFVKTLVSVYRTRFCGKKEGTYDNYPWYLTSFVKKILQTKHYDCCLVQYYYLTKLFKTVKFKKMACFTHDVFAYKNLIVNEPCKWIDANQEAKALQLCTDIFAIQEEEKNYFHALSPKSRIFNIYTPYTFKKTPYVGNRNILFLSGNNGYNQNGIKWFIENVYPLIKSKYIDARLLIAGGICNVIEGEYEHIDGIELKGYVDNPIDFYKLGDIAINPVYQGTGLKIKTFESISFEKVTLVHPHSVVGIYKKDKAPLFVSDKPEDWVLFLDGLWSERSKIEQVKKRDEEYIKSMNQFIKDEYRRFLEIML